MSRALLILVAIAALPACKHDRSDLCGRAVDHVMRIVALVDLAPPSGDEQKAIDLVIDATAGKCREEGLTQAQADCIFAAHMPDWDDQVRICPAFAAKPPSWVMLRPPREDRIRMRGIPLTPDGPREGPVHYRQLVAGADGTCGLTDAGAIQCWGQKPQPALPTGTFTRLAASRTQLCGLDASGVPHCTHSDAALPDRTPAEPLAAIAVDAYRGCGIHKTDGSLVCWNSLDDPPWDLPAGAFTDVAITHSGGCALGADHRVVCFGDEQAPDGTFQTIARAGLELCGLTTAGAVRCWSTKHPPDLAGTFTGFACDGKACCGLAADHHLTCSEIELGPAPIGTFETVALTHAHACAVRTGGGTVCWGENDGGACNVPQH